MPKLKNSNATFRVIFKHCAYVKKGNSQGEEANVASEISVISAKIGTTEKLRQMKFYYRR